MVYFLLLLLTLSGTATFFFQNANDESIDVVGESDTLSLLSFLGVIYYTLYP